MTLASRWTRRNALRAGSAGLALPALESLAQGADDAATTPTRLVCVGTYLGTLLQPGAVELGVVHER